MAITFSGPVPVPKAQTSSLTILVTGAARGLGFELVTQYANAHKDNIIFAAVRKSSDALSSLAKHNTNVHIVTLDQSDESSIRSSVKQVRAVSDHIDILINNAGIKGDAEAANPLKANTKQMTEVFVTNVVGPLSVVQSYLPLLQKSTKSPRVINVSSGLGSNMYAGAMGEVDFAYGVSKAALNYMNTSLRYVVKDVTFIAISPGWVETDMGKSVGAPPTKISDSVSAIRYYISETKLEDSGNFLDVMTGKIIPF